jgi:large subunit ribosomal protein L4
MKVKVLNQEGKETGREVELNENIFGVEPNNHAIYLAVKQYQAAQRQGTHKTKDRSEIARTTKKAFRQKGTGGARRGDMKSPLVRGGGRAFGPHPHKYLLKLNKKEKDLAKKSALSHKAQNNSILVVEDFSMAAPRTKDFTRHLLNLNLKDTKTVYVVSGEDKNTYLSSRNIPTLSMTQATNLNILDIMNCKTLVLSEKSLQAIVENLSNN